MEIQLKMQIPEMSNSGHAYLDELGMNILPYSHFNPNDERAEEWKIQHQIYGFDETETWSLDSTFYAWLYEHLRMYVDKADRVVNLNFHQFDWKGQRYSQLELINEILERIRFFFSDSYDEFNSEMDFEYIHEIGELWTLILPAMWW